MTVRARLILTIVGISALLTAPAIYGASKLKTLREIADSQRTGVAGAFRSLGKLQTALAELNQFERGYIITRGADQKAGIDLALVDVRAQLKALEQNYPEETKTASAHFDSIEEATANVVAMMTTGREAEATAYFDRVKPLLVNADRSIDAIATAIDAQSRGEVMLARRISGAARNTTLIALVLALSAAFALGYWTTHALTTPLR